MDRIFKNPYLNSVYAEAPKDAEVENGGEEKK